MHRLLRHVDQITRQRDGARLEEALVAAVHDLLGLGHACLHKLVPPHDGVALAVEQDHAGLRLHDDGISGPEATEPIESHPRLAECLQRKTPLRFRDGEVRWMEIFPVRGRKSEISGLLSLRRASPLARPEIIAVEALITVFENCHDLLAYSQSDTLTGLLNRKTFDEYLFKILSRRGAADHNAAGECPKRRHAAAASDDHWLCVMDIDHFKRINDQFGHMIGDEVLLMLANRMKAQFRSQDKLFRFGGEEFVVLLTPTRIEHAYSAFERFREAVANQCFPQVGHVTISMGFARFGPDAAASIVLGNADKALYWAKEHGRNRVCSYEGLVERGELEPQGELNAEVDFF